MNRVPLLNSYQSGFHARSRLLEGSMARLVMEAVQDKKGYLDPVLDIGRDVHVFEHPVECLNMYKSDREKPNPNPEGGYLTRGPTEALIPYRPYHEKWPWEDILALCSEEPCIRWRFEAGFYHTITEKIPGQKIERRYSANFWPRRNTESWRFFLSWHQTGDLDSPSGRLFTEKIGDALKGCLRVAGLDQWMSLLPGEEPGDWGLNIRAVKDPLPANLPLMEMEEKPGSWQGGPTFPRGPAEQVSLKGDFALPKVPFSLIGGLAGEILHNLQPPGDGIGRMQFRPDDTDIPAFREWAEPRFGGPWLQEIAGWATRSPSPDDIDDSLPDWVLLPVAYFKILGSRRIVTVVKEPGGWRFHVTGKYTKDPLKHRHIRDELARKAGMTSETLWEPQDAGEGWLGVPG